MFKADVNWNKPDQSMQRMQAGAPADLGPYRAGALLLAECNRRGNLELRGAGFPCLDLWQTLTHDFV